MTSGSSLRQQQLEWAVSAKLTADAKGYLPAYTDNLFQPLTPGALRAFTQGSGSELLPKEGRHAKMAALHSSSALAVNAFDYWSGKPLAPVADALGLEGVPTHFDFEAQFPTGLGGTPPNLDLVFRFPDGRLVGVESKYSEWFTPKASGQPFKPKYFADGAQLWAQAGLPAAQRLAEAMQRGERSFRYLDAPQLLKHMLGLAVAAPGKVSLYYLYFDCPVGQSPEHRAEIETFGEQVDPGISFDWLSYQDFLARMRRTLLDAEHRPYMDYMTVRYCGERV